MKVVRTVSELRAVTKVWKSEGLSQALVPTMGFLHEGHMSLVDIAKANADKSSVSIFVNPKQFNQASDLESYPRDEEADLAKLEARGVDLVFIPGPGELYPENFQTTINLSKLSEKFEGAQRPGHFAGVCTVVTLLFRTTLADKAVFGEKDFQQLRVVEQLVKDLYLDIEILRGPLVREEDGIAMSSRNVRLGEEARAEALKLSSALFTMQEKLRAGERDIAALKSLAAGVLEGVDIEYLELVKEENLEEAPELKEGEAYRALLAATVGGVHLLDNIALS